MFVDLMMWFHFLSYPTICPLQFKSSRKGNDDNEAKQMSGGELTTKLQWLPFCRVRPLYDLVLPVWYVIGAAGFALG